MTPFSSSNSSAIPASVPGSVLRSNGSSNAELGRTRRTAVAWNGSIPAASALSWACVREERAGSRRVHLVGVFDDTSGASGLLLSASDRLAYTALLESAAEHGRSEHPSLTFTTEVVNGDPARALLGCTDPGTLLTVGTHDRRKTEFTFGWSVGARLAAEASGPVAIVPEHPSEGWPNGDVVVGIDGGETSRQAAIFAAREAVERGRGLQILHAWQANDSGETLDEHESLLRGAARDISVRFPALHVRTVLTTSPAGPALLAAGSDASLVVVGNREGVTSDAFRSGQVARAVIMNLTTPTIVFVASDRSAK